MWRVFNIIETNTGITIEYTILMVLLFGCLVFYAKDFKLGLVMQLFISGLASMGFYYFGLNYSYAVILFFIFLVLLTLDLYAVSKSSSEGKLI